MTDPVTQKIGQAGEVTMLASTPNDPVHILAFHGGGGVAGTPDMMVPFAQRVTAGPGVTMALARYRTLNADQASFEDMRADAAQALDWAQAQIPAGGRLYLLGASFGGLLALDALLEASAEVQEHVTGLILLNAVTDTGPDGFANRVIKPEDHGHLSPIARLKGHPMLSRLRCFLAHGGQDDVVPIDVSHRFAALWPKDRCEMMPFPNSSHGFFNRAPHDKTVAAAVRKFVGATPIEPKRTGSTGLLPKGATMVYGIGAQKAGTSWLFDYLKQSEESHTVHIKELHYFDALYVKSEQSHLNNRLAQLRRAVDNLTPGMDPANRKRLRDTQLLAERLSIHAAAPGDHRPYVEYMTKGYAGQKIICDFTPSYCTLDAEGFREMDSLGPAKFIFILRDPVDRLWSQIRMAIGAQNPTLSDAAYEAKCVAHAQDLRDKRDIARIPRADYARTMEALEAAVPSDHIHYAFYEDLFSQDSVDEICAFLDIRPHKVAGDKRVNLGRSTVLPDAVEQMLSEALAPQYQAVRARFGDSVPAAWRESVVPLSKKAPQAFSEKAVRLLTGFGDN
ncbi:sulfotransferase [uncultured Tateyamaria sp.]|uniref:alpha/beta hydrolase fold domain-containing protein n=1 Tax=uncultured Tateyamaria sp. TaxID=455651 RepID=UPI00260B94A5|nr:sulfotransferase [uncultured Tateyamaria sp.]